MKAKNLKRTLILSALAGAIMIPGSAGTVYGKEAVEKPSAGIETALEEYYGAEVRKPTESYLVPTEQGEYLNMAFSNAGEYTYIRNAPDETGEWVGKLYKDCAAVVLDETGDYTRIQSGTVMGYVPTDTLHTGAAAKEHAESVGSRKVTVTADVLNVRDGQGTQANIITQIMQEEQYEVIGDSISDWYPLQVGELQGWVSGEYVIVEDVFSYAESKEEEAARLTMEAEAAEAAKEAERQTAEAEAAAAETAGPISSAQSTGGQAVIDYACQFIGNPYVWGGTSLTEGADCSGFVQSVYANFGIGLPRTTWDMETAGYEVSYENALPGDIILYDGHVGLYMGDCTIVNAIDSANGIGISNATFGPIITIRRMF